MVVHDLLCLVRTNAVFVAIPVICHRPMSSIEHESEFRFAVALWFETPDYKYANYKRYLFRAMVIAIQEWKIMSDRFQLDLKMIVHWTESITIKVLDWLLATVAKGDSYLQQKTMIWTCQNCSIKSQHSSRLKNPTGYYVYVSKLRPRYHLFMKNF